MQRVQHGNILMSKSNGSSFLPSSEKSFSHMQFDMGNSELALIESKQQQQFPMFSGSHKMVKSAMVNQNRSHSTEQASKIAGVQPHLVGQGLNIMSPGGLMLQPKIVVPGHLMNLQNSKDNKYISESIHHSKSMPTQNALTSNQAQRSTIHPPGHQIYLPDIGKDTPSMVQSRQSDSGSKGVVSGG